MADKSKIEWTSTRHADGTVTPGASLNPVRARNTESGKIGWHCEHATPGCEGCYAEGFNRRLGTGLPFVPQSRDKIELYLDDKMLTQPLRWKRGRTIFWHSMTDAFAEFMRDDWLDQQLAVCALTPQHRHIFLTKRPERMAEYFAERWQGTPAQRIEFSDGAHIDVKAGGETGRRHEIERTLSDILDEYDAGRLADTDNDALWDENGSLKARHFAWPLPNVLVGCSIEDQRRADERREPMRHLAEAGWKTIVSYEPALGPVDWQGWDFLAGLISGGESGPAARQSHPDWYRSARDFSLPRGIAYFHKQNGEWIDADEWFDQLESIPMVIRADGLPFPWMPKRPLNFDDAAKLAERTGRKGQFEHQSDGTTLIRVGKKAAGRLLDGVTHNGMPA